MTDNCAHYQFIENFQNSFEIKILCIVCVFTPASLIVLLGENKVLTRIGNPGPYFDPDTLKILLKSNRLQYILVKVRRKVRGGLHSGPDPQYGLMIGRARP